MHVLGSTARMREPVRRLVAVSLVLVAVVGSAFAVEFGTSPAAHAEPIPGGRVLRIQVPEAFGGKTVIGQLTVADATDPGHVTAYPCDDGIPTGPDGRVTRSDLNYNGRVSPIWSNRLIVQADGDGDICFHTLTAVELVIDVSGVSFDTGIFSFPNRRTDTRTGSPQRLTAGATLRLNIPEATHAKTVIGQLTVANATDPGHIIAYPCDGGRPTPGPADRSDLNYNGHVSPIWSNRLIVQADDDGDICFHALTSVDLVIDINGVADTGLFSFPNRRTDTRTGSPPRLTAGATLRLNIPEATHAKTVIGQLTVARATDPGHVTAYPCDDGIPTGPDGRGTRSDLNYNGRVFPIWSNRLIVQADDDGDICFHALTSVDLVIDINGVADTAIFSFPNRRTDTRTDDVDPEWVAQPVVQGVPVWPPYEPAGVVAGVAALTGLPATAAVRRRPIVAVKIDNYRLARPQWGLKRADAFFEVQVEGISRLIALFQTRLPTSVGPVRSARTGDLELLTAMNRPVFAFSGSNPGVAAWIDSAESSGLVVDRSAMTSGCYGRRGDRPGPHNLDVDLRCAVAGSPSAGAARPLWTIAATWSPPAGVASRPDAAFGIPMVGVDVGWRWDPDSRRYVREQDGSRHLLDADVPLLADTVVEITTTYIDSPVDERSPHVLTTGSGEAMVHREGRAYPAMWSRPTQYDRFVFRSASGHEIPVDSGVTFVELIDG